MVSGDYTIGDHPADLELTIRGKSLVDLFSTAARAAAETIVPGPVAGRARARPIALSAPSREELFVSWLNEIVYLLQAERLFPFRLKFVKLSPRRLLARASCRRAGRRAFAGGAEIKAATYHALALRRTKSGWVAHVILDL